MVCFNFSTHLQSTPGWLPQSVSGQSGLSAYVVLFKHPCRSLNPEDGADLTTISRGPGWRITPAGLEVIPCSGGVFSGNRCGFLTCRRRGRVLK